MMNELGTVSHVFPTLVTDIFTIVLLGVGSHVTFCVTFVLVFVITMFAPVPSTFTMTFNMMIDISYTFEGMRAALLGAG